MIPFLETGRAGLGSDVGDDFATFKFHPGSVQLTQGKHNAAEIESEDSWLDFYITVR